MPVTIRTWRDGDCLTHLTLLLHRAYGPLADAGMRFVASHQDEATTAERIAKGVCFVAELDGAIVGAIAYYRSQSQSDAGGCAWYERADVAVFGQFAVEPKLQRIGIGSRLLDHVEQQAHKDGAAELALDTSEHAAHLIAYYASRGYRHVGNVQWDCVNYRSVVMSKALRSDAHRGEPSPRTLRPPSGPTSNDKALPEASHTDA